MAISKCNQLGDQLFTAATAIRTCVNAIAMADLKGSLTYVNTAFLNLWGYDNDKEILGTHVIDFLQMQVEGKATKIIEAIIKNGGWIEELVAKREDGSTFDVQLSASMVTEDDGSPVCMMAFFLDITKRKQAEKELKQAIQTLQKALGGAIQAISLTVEARDPYTAGHQRRVAKLSCAIAKELTLSENQINAISMAAIVHDIGKIYVPAEILNKPGQLTENEFGIIKTHPQIGYDILKEIEFPWPVAQIVRQHHERMNGSGYPSGLSDDNIMMEARILGLADAVEAMVSHRPYRPALGLDKALEEISQNSGILYDPDVADACIKLFTKKDFEFE